MQVTRQTGAKKVSMTSADPELRLALLGSMKPWRTEFIQVLVSLGLPIAEIFDPTQGTWTEEARLYEEHVKKTVPWFIHYVTGGRDDPTSLGPQTTIEIFQLVQNRPGRGIYVFDANGLKPHHQMVLGPLGAELKESGEAVVTSLAEATSWLVANLGLDEGLRVYGLRETFSVVSKIPTPPLSVTPLEIAGSQAAYDSPIYDYWFARIKEIVLKAHILGKHVDDSWITPNAPLKRWLLKRGVVYQPLPSTRVLARLNEAFKNQAQMAVGVQRDYENEGNKLRIRIL